MMLIDKKSEQTALYEIKDQTHIPLLIKVLLVVLVLLCICLTVALILVTINRDRHSGGQSNSCKSVFPFEPALAKYPDVFQDLSEDEAHAVRDYLLSEKSLNLTVYDKASLQDNTITMIELYLPSKTDILQYLDNNGPKPTRRARVILQNGANKSPNIAEYIVEPLPKPQKHSVLKVKGRQYPIPFHARLMSTTEGKMIKMAMLHYSAQLYKVLKESFGYWYHNCTTHCAIPIANGIPGSVMRDTRQSWVTYRRNVTSNWLHILPLEILLDHKDSDAHNWKVLKVVYYYQEFLSIEDFLSKYNKGEVKKIKLAVPSEDDILLSSMHKRGKPFFPSPMRGPTLTEPSGRRFGVQGRKITYMQWQFNVGIRSSAGPALFDVRYNDTRVAFEIGVHEGASQYSGFSPEQSHQFIDSGFGLGSSNWQLIAGVDCPETAVFLDSVYFVNSNEAVRIKNSICIFENNIQIPLHRHREADNFAGDVTRPAFIAGLTTNALVVRVISTPYNYDYIFDFILHQSGLIEVRTTATGYVQASYYSKKEDEYGFQHFPGTIGTIHDHYLLYKVDLDIAGTKNSYQTLNVITKNLTNFQWEPGTYRIMKTVERKRKSTEKEALLYYNFDEPKYLLFYNENAKNRYGNYRGYRVQPGAMVKQKYPDNYFSTKATAWTKYQLAVTRQKDDERFGSSVYNQFSLSNPVFDFDSFIKDDETIVNQDLVAWITVGGLHIPNTEDVPVTVTPGNSYTFYLKPYGYFDEDPTMGAREAVYISASKDGTYKTETFGIPQHSVCPIPDRNPKFTL